MTSPIHRKAFLLILLPANRGCQCTPRFDRLSCQAGFQYMASQHHLLMI
jgi:hypothetical protein